MAEVYQPAFIAPAAGQTSATNTLDCFGLERVWLEVSTTVTAATLNFTLDITESIDPLSPFWVPNNGVVLGPAPTGYSFNAATARLTVANPDVGVSSCILIFARPAKLLKAVYTFGSGGGTIAVSVSAYGWQTSTTP